MKRLMRYKTLQCFLAALIMIAFLAPAAYASGTPDAYEASANAVSEKYIGKTVPGACVVISEHDNTVFAKGYGFADLENNTAMDPETTVFEWGSISKTFVWVSVMQLVEDRKIDLETDIRTYLPDGFLKNLRFAEPVTLLHLMNHTAGFEEELLICAITARVRKSPSKKYYVAGVGIAAAICGFFTGISHAVKRKTRVSVLTIVLFALQIISAWMLGFLTVV